jgi:hypothetical protein
VQGEQSIVVVTSDAAAVRTLADLPKALQTWWGLSLFEFVAIGVALNAFLGVPVGASVGVAVAVTWLPLIAIGLIRQRAARPVRAHRAAVLAAVADRIADACVAAGLPEPSRSQLAVILGSDDNGPAQHGGPGPAEPLLRWQLAPVDRVPGTYLVADRGGQPEVHTITVMSHRPDGIPTRSIHD